SRSAGSHRPSDRPLPQEELVAKFNMNNGGWPDVKAETRVIRRKEMRLLWGEIRNQGAPRVQLALDPGGTTGYCLMREEPDGKHSFEQGEIKGKHHVELMDKLGEWYPNSLIVEDFIWQRRTSVDFRPVHIIGVIQLWAAMYGRDIWYQSPSDKNFWSNDKLKKVGLYVAGSEHARDATRHMLYWDAFTRKRKGWLEMVVSDG